MLKNGVIPFIISFLFICQGCSGYEKLLKSDDFEAKAAQARVYYNEGNYAKALPLLDQLLAVKSGTADEEEIRYFIAYSHYGQSEYLLSASLFKSFWLAFPRSYRAEECLYMSAYALYRSSPVYELDQTETTKALEAFQFFIDTYDKSNRVQEANDIMDELRLKLETKMYESANLYYNSENYQAAAITYENMLESFPETDKAEAVGVLVIRSYFNYALQSIVCKKADRYDKAIASYITFKDRYPNSAYLKEADGLYNRALSMKQKAIKEQENYNCNE